jgi:hypothetical protein
MEGAIRLPLLVYGAVQHIGLKREYASRRAFFEPFMHLAAFEPSLACIWPPWLVMPFDK